MDKITFQTKLEKDNHKEFEVEAICNNEIYAKESDSDYLPGFYYLVS